MNYNTFDIYAKKKFGKLSLAAEVPITSGYVGSTPDPSQFLDYSTYRNRAWKQTTAPQILLRPILKQDMRPVNHR